MELLNQQKENCIHAESNLIFSQVQKIMPEVGQGQITKSTTYIITQNLCKS